MIERIPDAGGQTARAPGSDEAAPPLGGFAALLRALAVTRALGAGTAAADPHALPPRPALAAARGRLGGADPNVSETRPPLEMKAASNPASAPSLRGAIPPSTKIEIDVPETTERPLSARPDAPRARSLPARTAPAPPIAAVPPTRIAPGTRLGVIRNLVPPPPPTRPVPAVPARGGVTPPGPAAVPTPMAASIPATARPESDPARPIAGPVTRETRVSRAGAPPPAPEFRARATGAASAPAVPGPDRGQEPGTIAPNARPSHLGSARAGGAVPHTRTEARAPLGAHAVSSTPPVRTGSAFDRLLGRAGVQTIPETKSSEHTRPPASAPVRATKVPLGVPPELATREKPALFVLEGDRVRVPLEDGARPRRAGPVPPSPPAAASAEVRSITETLDPIVRRLALLASARQDAMPARARVALPGTGPVDVAVRRTPEGLDVEILTEDPAVRDRLGARTGQIEQALRARGVLVREIAVAAREVSRPSEKARGAFVRRVEGRAAAREATPPRGDSGAPVTPPIGPRSPASAAPAPAPAIDGAMTPPGATSSGAEAMTLAQTPAIDAAAARAGVTAPTTGPDAPAASGSTAPAVFAERLVPGASRLVLRAIERGGEARIVLNPPELGRMEVRVAEHDGKLRVVFEVTNAAVRDVLLAAEADLAVSLREQGLSLGGMTVGLDGEKTRGEGGSHRPAAAQSSAGEAGDGEHGSTETDGDQARAAIGSSRLDVLA